MSRLVQALIDEGQTAGAFDIDSMPFAVMEMFGHGREKDDQISFPVETSATVVKADRNALLTIQEMVVRFFCNLCRAFRKIERKLFVVAVRNMAVCQRFRSFRRESHLAVSSVRLPALRTFTAGGCSGGAVPALPALRRIWRL